MTAELLVVGISWRTAPVSLREHLAIADDEVPQLLRALVAVRDVGEAVLISTCNRVEVYVAAQADAAGVAAEVQRLLIARAGSAANQLAPSMYHHAAGAAVRHVFRVASALDSLVLGEAQILGQLKAAFRVASGAGTTGPYLGRCLERAFGAAKRVRSETELGRGAANVSTVAVDLAGRVFGDLADKVVLVVGAGKMSTLAARHLRAAGVTEIMVTNRSPERAAALASVIDGVARPWERLEELLGVADVVISSTGARQPILTQALMRRVTKARRYRPLMVVDIAVPRDADPSIAELEGVYLFDIDDLERVVAANRAERAKAAEAAERIVEHEVGQFLRWLGAQRVVPTIRALRDRFGKVAAAEVERTVEALRRRDLSHEQRDEAIRRLGQLIIAKLLHSPQTALKDGDPVLAEERAEALCALFDLDPTGYEGGDPGDAELEVPGDALANESEVVPGTAAKRGAR